MSRDWLLYLDDLVQSAEKICRYVDGLSFEEFCANEPIFDAVLFNLQVIGEAAKQLPDTAKAAMPEIEWSGPARFRDIIAHHYFALDPDIVWDVAVHRVPELLATAKRLLVRFDQGGESGKPS
ncbi:MAG: HepT-like ribonuclease domain-containing protein [Methylococcales bacterium]